MSNIDADQSPASPVRYLAHCLFCFGQHSCSLRFTRHGKPYLACQLCMSRTFLNRLDGLRGPAIVPLLIAEARTAGSLAKYEEQFRELTAYVMTTMSALGAAEAPAPIPYDVAQERKG